MRHTILDAPRAKPRHVKTLFYGDCAILMPAEPPITARALIEQDGSYRKASRAKKLRWNPADASCWSQPARKPGDGKQPYPCSAISKCSER